MNAPSNHQTDVLIVGVGPTGLVLALWLTRMGVRVRIVDKAEKPGTTSRALAVQARTLELEVERLTELLDFEDATGQVRARLKRPDGAEEMYAASFIAECDGAHSKVRKTLAFASFSLALSRFDLVFRQDAHVV